MKEYISRNDLDNKTIQQYIVHLTFHLKLSSQWGTPHGVNVSRASASPIKVNTKEVIAIMKLI
jgi:hypothetical protein